MAIQLDDEGVGKQGFPVVCWEEDRNLFAPEGHGPARVACFIKPDEHGVLQFVCVGSVRHGQFVEARPWDKLKSFERATAEHLYFSAGDRAALDSRSSFLMRRIFRRARTSGSWQWRHGS
jgi:hypothetical protein